MRLFMDVHALEGGISARQMAEAHLRDLNVQDRYGVNYLRYWVDERAGKVFCLVEAPSAEAAMAVHREAHGMVTGEIYEVEEGF